MLARNRNSRRRDLRFARQFRRPRQGDVHRAGRPAQSHLAPAARPRPISPARRALRPDRLRRARPREASPPTNRPSSSTTPTKRGSRSARICSTSRSSTPTAAKSSASMTLISPSSAPTATSSCASRRWMSACPAPFAACCRASSRPWPFAASRQSLPPRTILWEFVNLIEPDPLRRVKLRLSSQKLAELHPGRPRRHHGRALARRAPVHHRLARRRNRRRRPSPNSTSACRRRSSKNSTPKRPPTSSRK